MKVGRDSRKVDKSVGRSASLSGKRGRCQETGTLLGGGDVVRGRGRRQGSGDVTVSMWRRFRVCRKVGKSVIKSASL